MMTWSMLFLLMVWLMDDFVCGRQTEGGSPSGERESVAWLRQEPVFAQFPGEQAADFGCVRTA